MQCDIKSLQNLNVNYSLFIEIEVAQRRLSVNVGDEQCQILDQKEIKLKKMKVIKKERECRSYGASFRLVREAQ